MQPTLSQTTDPESPNGSVKPGRAAWRSAVKTALSCLKGWRVIPASVIAFYFFIGIFGPILAPFEPNRGTIATRLCPPLAIDALTIAPYPASRSTECSSDNILGTDQNGRDIFSRLLHGARTSLWVVGLSVIIGAAVGSVLGAVVNGWRRRGRLVAYAIWGFAIVPFAIFVFGQPHTLYIFGVIDLASVMGAAVDWSSVVALSSFSAVLTFALVAVAYQFDQTCHRSWFSEVDSEDASRGFCQLLHKQIFALAPWIGLAALANAALVFLQSGSRAYQSSAITWSFEWEYVFEHIGMLSPFVPMVLFPISFVTFGAWWFVRHVQGRFVTTAKVSQESAQSVADSAEELSTGEESDHFESRSFENDGNDAAIESGSKVKRRRWLPALVAIVAVLMIARFGVYEAWPNVRYLLQDSSTSSESPAAQSSRDTNQAMECASEVGSKLMSLGGIALKESDLNPGQRCLDLYYQRRNAPTHHLTFDFILKMVSQTLTMALIGTVTATALLVATLGTTTLLSRAVQIIVGLVALTGLTITFGRTAWLVGVFHWIEPTVVIWSDRGFAIQGVLAIFRDFSVALGIGFMIAATLIAILHRARTVPMFNAVFSWASLLLPCVCVTAGLMVVFHYPFPSNLLIIDDQLAIIADPSEEQFFRSRNLLFRNWLWTYWFALVCYAAIVFGFFAAAIWGFRRFVSSASNGVDSTPLNPDSPSQDVDPT